MLTFVFRITDRQTTDSRYIIVCRKERWMLSHSRDEILIIDFHYSMMICFLRIESFSYDITNAVLRATVNRVFDETHTSTSCRAAPRRDDNAFRRYKRLGPDSDTVCLSVANLANLISGIYLCENLRGSSQDPPQLTQS